MSGQSELVRRNATASEQSVCGVIKISGLSKTIPVLSKPLVETPVRDSVRSNPGSQRGFPIPQLSRQEQVERAAVPARHTGALIFFASCVKHPDYRGAGLDIGGCRSNNKVWRIQPQEFDEERGYS